MSQETAADSNAQTLLPNPTPSYLNDPRILQEWIEYLSQPNIFRASIDFNDSAQAALSEVQEQISIPQAENSAEQQPSENSHQTTVSTTIQTVQTSTTKTTTLQPPNPTPARPWVPHPTTPPTRYYRQSVDQALHIISANRWNAFHVHPPGDWGVESHVEPVHVVRQPTEAEIQRWIRGTWWNRVCRRIGRMFSSN